jgi:dolichol-phosphate mannosyltransferase
MITVLLPTLNEEDAIGCVIRNIPYAELAARGHEVEVLVVDGNSTDATRKIARALGARVILQEGYGKGSAVRTGIKHFRGEYLVMLDGDNTYPPGYILPILTMLERGNLEVVIGTRLKGYIKKDAMSLLNYIGNRALTWVGNLLFHNGHSLSDICSGMWGFRRYVLEELHLNSTGFEIEAELFAKCINMGYRIGELPIVYRKRNAPPKLKSLYDGTRIACKLLCEYF